MDRRINISSYILIPVEWVIRTSSTMFPHSTLTTGPSSRRAQGSSERNTVLTTSTAIMSHHSKYNNILLYLTTRKTTIDITKYSSGGCTSSV